MMVCFCISIIRSRMLLATCLAQTYWSKHSAVCQQVNAAPNPLAKEELNLLAKLMGGLEVQKPGNADTGFRVNLFATDEEEEWVFWVCCEAVSLCKKNELILKLSLLSQRSTDIKTRWAFIWSHKHPSNKGKVYLTICLVQGKKEVQELSSD